MPGTSRNLGDRNNSSFLAAVNAYRATLGLAAIPASQIDSSRFNSFDILVSRAFLVKEQRRLEAKAQLFNLFGTQNLAGGNTTSAVSANFGRILAAGNLQQAELAVRLVF